MPGGKSSEHTNTHTRTVTTLRGGVKCTCLVAAENHSTGPGMAAISPQPPDRYQFCLKYLFEKKAFWPIPRIFSPKRSRRYSSNDELATTSNTSHQIGFCYANNLSLSAYNNEMGHHCSPGSLRGIRVKSCDLHSCDLHYVSQWW